MTWLLHSHFDLLRGSEPSLNMAYGIFSLLALFSAISSGHDTLLHIDYLCLLLSLMRVLGFLSPLLFSVHQPVDCRELVRDDGA